MKPIPLEAMRRIVQASSEITCNISPTPSGKAVVDAIETLLDAMDAYGAEAKAAAPPA